MRRDPRVLLADIALAGADIDDFTEGMDRDAYVADARTQAAVERKFGIVGEALSRLGRFHPELAVRIPQARQAVEFRDLLARGGDRVSPQRVWIYAKSDLPGLRAVVQALLAELEPPEA